MLLYHKCPVCNNKCGNKIGKLSYSLFDNHILDSEYDIVSCSNCGFVMYNTEKTQEDYNNYYKKHFYSHAYIEREINEDEERYTEDICYRLIPYINKLSKIFDIGCGNGLLLKRLKKSGFDNIYGVELSESCIKSLKKVKLNVKQGSIFNIPFDEKANVITLSHILEHIIDLKLALQNIKDKLSDNGLVYVEVPDTLRYNDFKNISALRYFYLQHVIHFDMHHLQNLFESNGFVEVNSGYCTRIEGNLQMPCVWGLFKKKSVYFTLHQSILSCKIKSLFEDYNKFEVGNFSMLDNNNILKNLVKSKKKVYIWGLGIHMNMMLSMSPIKKCKEKIYVDNDERNRKETINGNKIYSSEILNKATKDDVIILGAPTHLEEMYKYIIDIKFEGQIIKCGFGNVERCNK